jgi:transposase
MHFIHNLYNYIITIFIFLFFNKIKNFLIIIYMDLDIKIELKNIILNTEKLKDTYIKKHSNSKYSLELIISEILYFLRSGVSWRMLRSIINYKTLHWHYTLFVKYNIFVKLFNKIKSKYLNICSTETNTLYIDSTIIYNKNGTNKIGRNKFYKNKKTTKISLMTDKNGFPFSILFMKGNYHDITVFNKHIRDAKLIQPKIKKTIIADKAYASNKNYKLLEENNFDHIIPPRKNMKIASTYTYDKDKYKKRIKIEHIFGRLKIFKRIDQRNDKLLRNYKGFVHLAFTQIAINILNKQYVN